MANRYTPTGQWIDTISNGGVAISSPHAWIHAGRAFDAGYLWNEASEIADNASAELLLQLTDGAHTIIHPYAAGQSEFHLFRNPTFDPAGTAVTVFNKNEYSATASTMVVTRDPTVSVAGTELPPFLIPGGSGPLATGGGDGGFERERILKGGNNYLIRITNRSGGAAAISIGIEFYEPE